eukprot:jgi/Bigna1/139235/aug1.49_g13943
MVSDTFVLDICFSLSFFLLGCVAVTSLLTDGSAKKNPDRIQWKRVFLNAIAIIATDEERFESISTGGLALTVLILTPYIIYLCVSLRKLITEIYSKSTEDDKDIEIVKVEIKSSYDPRDACSGNISSANESKAFPSKISPHSDITAIESKNDCSSCRSNVLPINSKKKGDFKDSTCSASPMKVKTNIPSDNRDASAKKRNTPDSKQAAFARKTKCKLLTTAVLFSICGSATIFFCGLYAIEQAASSGSYSQDRRNGVYTDEESFPARPDLGLGDLVVFSFYAFFVWFSGGPWTFSRFKTCYYCNNCFK